MASAGAESFGYDGAGRVTSLGRDGGVALAYDSDDHVTSVTRSGGTTSYAFDGSGRRVRVSSGGTERRFLVAPSLAAGYESPHLVTDGAGATLASYVYAGEHALARYEAGGPTYYLRDAMGSVIALADESGARVARLDYDAFGNVRGSAGSASGLPVETAGDFRYHGMWMDPTGLYYVRARSYDPVTGRFVSKDPVSPDPSTPESLHPNVFARSAPTLFIDPDGRFTLLGLQVSITIGSNLKPAEAYFGKQARDRILDHLGEAVGNLIGDAIGKMLPAASSAFQSEAAANAQQRGTAWEQLGSFNLCGFLPPSVDAALGGLHLEVPISGVGRPLGEGFNCSVSVPTSRQDFADAVSGIPRGSDIRPDFIYAMGSMDAVARGERRSWLIGDFKTNASNIRSSGFDQLRAMGAHAADYGYRVVMLVSLKPINNKPQLLQTILSIGLREGAYVVLVGP